MMRYLFIMALVILGCLTACKDETSSSEKTVSPSDVERFMKDYNKDVAMEELEQIDLVLERYQWDVTETGTGLRYWIYKKGSSKKIQKGDVVSCNYSIKLINGKEIYNSQTDGLLTFEVGNSNITPGLSEAILLLHEGDCAKIVVPSNLSYGLAGDGKRVPSRATLFYDLQDIKVLIVKTNENQ